MDIDIDFLIKLGFKFVSENKLAYKELPKGDVLTALRTPSGFYVLRGILSPLDEPLETKDDLVRYSIINR